ncbi:helix-turn-helix transcriptional regulator [Hirschia litorea]|uniref:Helix-turn-helix transcriptional regulator n=1 Tax=Hirschia litorea TaxID=1199156 RepID=A0ABW2IN11_9PROT
MDDKLITINEVCQRFNINRSTYYRWIKENPEFPKPIVLNKNSKRFRLSEIKEFEEARRCSVSNSQALH